MWVGSSVATAPGSISVTRTSGSSSRRSDSDQPFMPHLVAAYTPLPGRAVRPATDEMFTMSPPPSLSWSRNTSVVVIAPSRLTSIICR